MHLFILCKYFLQRKMTCEVWWFSQSTVLWHKCPAQPARHLLKAEEVLKTAAAFTMHKLFNRPKKPPAQQCFEAALLPSCDHVQLQITVLTFKENNR